MLCERCKKQQASIHMQQFLNGETKEVHLCQDCVKYAELTISFDNFLKGYLDNFFSQQHLKSHESNKLNTEKTVCESCGQTYEKFKNTGRLGCAVCYNTFRNELNSIFKNVQGSNIHQGKFPKKSGSKLLVRRQIEELKVNLKKAIENEEFEQAAKLRDEIKDLTRQGGDA